MDEWEIQGGQDCWTASEPMPTRRLTFGFNVYKGNIHCASGRYEQTMFTKFDPKLNQWTNPVDSICGLEVNAIVPFLFRAFLICL